VGSAFTTGLDGALDPCVRALQPGSDASLCCPIVAQTLQDTLAVAGTTGDAVAAVFTQALAGAPPASTRPAPRRPARPPRRRPLRTPRRPRCLAESAAGPLLGCQEVGGGVAKLASYC